MKGRVRALADEGQAVKRTEPEPAVIASGPG